MSDGKTSVSSVLGSIHLCSNFHSCVLISSRVPQHREQSPGAPFAEANNRAHLWDALCLGKDEKMVGRKQALTW